MVKVSDFWFPHEGDIAVATQALEEQACFWFVDAYPKDDEWSTVVQVNPVYQETHCWVELMRDLIEWSKR